MEAKLWKFIILISLLLLGVVNAEKQESWRYYVPPERLLSPRITCLYLDTTDSAVYVGTASGLNRIGLKSGRITSYGRSVNLPYGEIDDFAKGNRGRLWCIVEGQVYVFTRNVFVRSRWYKCVLEDLDTGEVATVLEAGPEDMTIGTNKGSIYAREVSETLEPEMVGKQDTTEVSVEGSTNLPVPSPILNMAYWDRGIYFLATSNGLVKFYSVSDAVEKVRREGILSNSINCVEVGSDSTVWFADSNFVGRFNLSDKSSATELLPISSVHTMSFDPIGHLWCVNDNALFEVYPKEFDPVEHPLPDRPGFQITTLLALSENQVLLGTDKGLFLFNPPRPVVSAKVTGVEESEDGVLVKFKVRDFSPYPHLILKWSIDESDYSEWLIIEAKTNHTLNIGTLEDGEHELRIIVKPPLEGVDSTEVSYVFRMEAFALDWRIIVVISIVVVVVSIFIWIYFSNRRAETKRLRSKKRLLKRNPYIVGSRPIKKTEQFIGRQEILNAILQVIHNNSVLVYGERRIGKTSLLYQIRNRLRDEKDDGYKIIPIMIDLERFEFAEKIRRRKDKSKPAKCFYTNLAHEIAKVTYSKSDRAKILKREYYYSKFETFMELQSSRLQKKYLDKIVRVILLIDEGDEMAAYGPDFHKQFRGLFQSNYADNFNIVLALKEFDPEWQHKTSPWYNFFDIKELGPLTREETYRLVKSYVLGAIKYTKGALRQIWEGTEGHPYEVQRLCSRIYNSLDNRVYVYKRDVLLAQKEVRRSLRRNKRGRR